VRIDDQKDGLGRLVAFEVDSCLGRRGALKVVRTIPGVRIIKGPRDFLAWWDDDTFLEFEIQDVTFVGWEAFGDSSEYWIGPEPVRPVPQIHIVREAFVHAPRWLVWRWRIFLLAYGLLGAVSVGIQLWRRFRP
jgi:hypothetical protein